VVDRDPKRVQVVPRAVDPDQRRVQVAPNRPQQPSRAAAEAEPKSSKHSAGCTIGKTDDPYDAFQVFEHRYSSFQIVSFHIYRLSWFNCRLLPVMKYAYESV
jgi:hypothetical protein